MQRALLPDIAQLKGPLSKDPSRAGGITMKAKRVALFLSAATVALAVGLSPVTIDPYPLHAKSQSAYAHAGGGGGGSGGGGGGSGGGGNGGGGGGNGGGGNGGGG